MRVEGEEGERARGGEGGGGGGEVFAVCGIVFVLAARSVLRRHVPWDGGAVRRMALAAALDGGRGNVMLRI